MFCNGKLKIFEKRCDKDNMIIDDNYYRRYRKFKTE